MDLKQVKENWDALGQADAFYAVLSDPRKRGNKWEQLPFFETGVSHIRKVVNRAKDMGQILKYDQALDFGCGVGRLTQALCAYFKQVVGVDIAPSMIEKARAFNRFGDRCRYILNETDDLACFPDGSFDFILTDIVLQHMEPRYSLKYIREFLRVLRKGGFLVFHLPARPRYSGIRKFFKRFVPRCVMLKYRVWRFGRDIPPEIEVEMHSVPRRKMTEYVESLGAKVLDFQEGMYWVKKG